MSDLNSSSDQNRLSDTFNEIGPQNEVDDKAVMSIIDMGFSREEALHALNRSNQDVSRAIEYIFNNSPVISSMDPPQSQHIEVASYDETLVPYAPPPSPRQKSGFYETNDMGSISLEETGPPQDRRHHETPALLFGSLDGPYIAPLLVIMHKIPLARKALLNAGNDLVENYGFDPDWWNGSMIDVNHEASDLAAENTSEKLSIQHTSARLAIELQRLMLFLDGKSKRQYARLDNLIKQGAPMNLLEILSDPSKDESPIGGLFNSLVTFWGRDSAFSKVFQTHVHVDESSPESASTVFSSLLCDATIAMADDLYDLIDDMVWPPPGMPDNYLHDIADILCLTIKRDDGESGAGIPVSEIWYPARYTKTFMRFIKSLKERKAEIRKQVVTKNKQLDEFAVFNGNDGTKLLANCVKHLEGLANEDKQIQDALKDISNIQNHYETKKTSEKSEIQKMQEESKTMDKLFHGPLDDTTFKHYFPDEQQPSMDPYKLRGVIISPAEYCFYTDYDFNGDETLIDMEDEGSWWKVVPDDNGCPMTTTISESDVLDWAKTGSDLYKWQEVVLIYADEKACQSSENQFDLGKGLKEFQNKDKESFENDHQRFSGVSKPSSETLINSYEMEVSD